MTSRARRNSLIAALTLAALALAVAVGYVAFRSGPGASTSAEETPLAPRYTCPMHPSVVSDAPGDCPICGMSLVPIEEPEHPAEEDEGAGAPSGPDGRANVLVSEAKRQLIGVRTAPAARGPLVRTIRTVGRVTYDETRLHHVHTKIAGWVENLYANAVGETVHEGQPLLTIYSPELVASSQEYLLALRARDRLAGTTLPSVRGGGEDLVASARRRLLLFDLTPDQIGTLEERGEAPRTMTLFSSISGHIISRNVTQGEEIQPGTNLLDIADLSRVWVLADVYEYEMPFVKEGQKATMSLSYLPGRTFEGRITLVYPFLSATTRTVKIRLEFPNHDLLLKPEMYADVLIRSDLGERLLVPESAVISTGSRDVVFVEAQPGTFVPRAVRLGVRLPEGYEVLEGLREGDPIVVSGSFLIDSESRLRAAVAAAGDGEPDAGASGSPDHQH